MTYTELSEKIKNIYNNYSDEYNYIGIRFEDEERQTGDICNNSRHNSDRDDERDFPEYGSQEYSDLEELNGASAWNVSPGSSYSDLCVRQNKGSWEKMDDEIEQSTFSMKHLYVIAGNCENTPNIADDNEIVIEDAVVLTKLW